MKVNQATLDFIQQHRTDDVRKLALQGAKHTEVDMTYALEQIAGWQKARTKLPSWAARDGIIYPPHLSMEQCSSEATAIYKAQIAGSRQALGSMLPLLPKVFNRRLSSNSKRNCVLLHLGIIGNLVWIR